MRIVSRLASVLLVSISLLAAERLVAAQETRRASIVPPQQAVLSISPEGEWRLAMQVEVSMCKPVTETYTVQVPVTVEKVELVEGKEVKKLVTEYKVEARTATKMACETKIVDAVNPVNLSTMKAFETSGQPISAEEVAKRCPKETLVVVSANDEMLSSRFAELFKPGTIILALSGQKPVAAVPTPAPSVALAPSAPAPVIPPVAAAPAPSPIAATSELKLPALAPRILYAKLEGEERLHVRVLSEKTQSNSLKAIFTEKPDGPAVMKMVPTQQLHQESVTTTIPWSLLKTSGDAEQVKAELRKGERLVVLSGDGREVDPFWLQNFKPSTPVLKGVILPATAPVPLPTVAAPALPAAPAIPATPVLPAAPVAPTTLPPTP